MHSLIVVRIVYVDDIARSISVPCEPFTGENAQLNAASYVRSLITGKNTGGPNRTEYHVLPAGVVAGTSQINLQTWSPMRHPLPTQSEDSEITGVRVRRVPTKKFGITG